MAGDHALRHQTGVDFPNRSRKVHIKVATVDGGEGGPTIFSGFDRGGSFVWIVSHYDADLDEIIVGWTDDRRVADDWAELWPRSFVNVKVTKLVGE